MNVSVSQISSGRRVTNRRREECGEDEATALPLTMIEIIVSSHHNKMAHGTVRRALLVMAVRRSRARIDRRLE